MDSKSDSTLWGEPLRWHSFFGHSFRFHKSVLASPSRRRGLEKGTAFESPSPAVLYKSFGVNPYSETNSLGTLAKCAHPDCLISRVQSIRVRNLSLRLLTHASGRNESLPQLVSGLLLTRDDHERRGRDDAAVRCYRSAAATAHSS
jgi:hypothetical protein